MPIPSISMETQMLVKRLAQAQEDDLIEWNELTRLIGKDVQLRANGLLQTAKRICAREKQIAFETISGKGIRRLFNNEIPGAVRGHIKGIHKKAGRGIVMLMCTDPDKLVGIEKASYHLNGTMLHFLRTAASGRTVKKIAQRSQTETLTFGDTLKLFETGK